MYHSAVFIGPPGVGKTTQSVKLAEENEEYFHFSMGQALRDAQANDPDVNEILKAGNLVPSEKATQIMRDSLDKSIEQGDYSPDSDLLLLDGIPRTIDQAQIMKEHFYVQYVFYMRANEYTLKHRLLNRGRYDDTEEIIDTRFQNYKEKTLPVIDYYEQYQIYLLDGSFEIEEVQNDLLNHLK